MIQRGFASSPAWILLFHRTTTAMAPVMQGKILLNESVKKKDMKSRIPDKIKRFKHVSCANDMKKNCGAKRKILAEPTSYFSAKKQGRFVTTDSLENGHNSENSNGDYNLVKRTENPKLSPVLVGLDCEMVECKGGINTLARCSVVNYFGEVVEDLYVKPELPVTDYRTRYSGITKACLEKDSCVDVDTARDIVKNRLRGKIVVGHSIKNDYAALGYTHPKRYYIDLIHASTMKLLMPDHTSGDACSLRFLTKKLLNRTIQKGRHCSVEDARATVDLFRLVEDTWLSENESVIADLQLENKSFFDDKYWPDYIENDCDDDP